MKRQAGRTFVRALALVLPVACVAPRVACAETLHVLGVDRDDDDVDGRPDAEQEIVSSSKDLFELPLPSGTNRALVVHGDAIRVLINGKELVGTQVPPNARDIWVQGIRPGRAEVVAFGRSWQFSTLEVRPVDGQDQLVDMTRSHASFERTPPRRLGDNPHGPTDDLDALRFVLVSQPIDLPPVVQLVARDPGGRIVDTLDSVAFGSVACPTGRNPPLACGSTVPIRIVPDEIDRNHPTTVDRSIRAVLGGAIEVVLPTNGRRLGALRVGGPRKTSLGPLVRYRGRLRVFLVRPTVGGPPPVGSDDAGAQALVRAEVAQAGALWAACGIGFGPPSELEVSIVDPPRSHLLAFGCDHGLSASGGGKLQVRIDGHDVSVTLERGVTPGGAARVFAAAAARAGFSPSVSDNPAIGAAVRGSSDVLVRRKSGELALVEAPSTGAMMTDTLLTVCLGRVDLEDGFQHFGDIDAIAGTIEERALIKAFADGDPSTIEVFIISSFANGGRIGESFIGADGGSVRNVLIEDRAALRADRASFALAHELGHVFLDEPGHPDDFGRDTPSRLMDADAADGTAFGPRRLLLGECARVFRQSGPTAPVPLLHEWPLRPLGKER